jgi:dihydrofolate reductase
MSASKEARVWLTYQAITMNISIIVAMTKQRVIGYQNALPWHLPADLKNFKRITMGAPILMGRKTYQSIGRPLPGRDNIIVTNNAAFQAEGCRVFTHLDDALAAVTAPEVFVIGGASLYTALFAATHTLYVTEIDKVFKGDTFFPEWQHAEWQEFAREEVSNDPSVDFSYRFLTYKRSTAK